MSQTSSNHFKFGASGISSATRGGFKVGVKGGADYGPTSQTGFWNGVKPPIGGYTIYVNKASQGPSIHVAYNDTECINMLLHMGSTGSTISNVLAWASAQSNMAVLSAELTLGDLPGGPTPTPVPPTSTPTPTPTITPTPATYTIGQAALGGIIAYINGGGSSGTSGFVVTSADLPPDYAFGCVGVNIATDTAIGTGQSNTNKIIAGCYETGNAAHYVDNLVEGGYSDWYLPSKDELNVLYSNRVALGGFSGGPSNEFYQSSSQADSIFVFTQNLVTGQVYTPGKNGPRLLRAIRSF